MRAEGGFALRTDLTIALRGLHKDDPQLLVETAHKTCPYSKATRDNVSVRLVVP
jgi:organic hydroperoxide reductase OsmC/OhrA